MELLRNIVYFMTVVGFGYLVYSMQRVFRRTYEKHPKSSLAYILSYLTTLIYVITIIPCAIGTIEMIFHKWYCEQDKQQEREEILSLHMKKISAEKGNYLPTIAEREDIAGENIRFKTQIIVSELLENEQRLLQHEKDSILHKLNYDVVYTPTKERQSPRQKFVDDLVK